MAENGDMRRHLGVSRRDLIRRGAIVGGTLVWTIPVISTLSKNASTHEASGTFTCCQCVHLGQTRAFLNVASAADCASLCASQSNPSTSRSIGPRCGSSTSGAAPSTPSGRVR